MPATPLAELSPIERQRRSQFYARMTYVTIIGIFFSICAVAVLTMMSMERNKQGFQAIELSKPIAFFDYTYVKKPQR